MSRIDRKAKIYVAGHAGLAGSAIVRRLVRDSFTNILTRTRQDLDLREQDAVRKLFRIERPRYAVLAAATVGGILANATRPADFLYDNLMIAANFIEAAREAGVQKLIFLGSTCVYPKFAEQPIREDALLTGPLEPTNEAYAIAKIAGLKLCEAYARQHGLPTLTLMPTNLYGPGDNFDSETSHVLPALMAKAHRAKADGIRELEVWGTGTPLREFLHADDLADAVLFCLDKDARGTLNVGSGREISIADLARLVCKTVGFRGTIRFDTSKPDGTPRKFCDTSRLAGLGWRPQINLESGLGSTYEWFVRHAAG